MAWSAARGYQGRADLPWSVRFILGVLKDNFAEDMRMSEVHLLQESAGECFRADAKADTAVDAGAAATASTATAVMAGGGEGGRRGKGQVSFL